MANHLGRLAKACGRETEAQAAASAKLVELDAETVERIFDEGLHEYLTRFIRRAAGLGQAVHDGYLSGEVRI